MEERREGTYAFRNVLAGDDGSSFRNETGQDCRDGRIHSEAFVEDGLEVSELIDGGESDVFVSDECGSDFIHKPGVRGRVAKEVVRAS